MKKIQFNALNVILIVITTALVGMILGGAFGYAAGNLAPDFFATTAAYNIIAFRN